MENFNELAGTIRNKFKEAILLTPKSKGRVTAPIERKKSIEEMSRVRETNSIRNANKPVETDKLNFEGLDILEERLRKAAK